MSPNLTMRNGCHRTRRRRISIRHSIICLKQYCSKNKKHNKGSSGLIATLLSQAPGAGGGISGCR